MRSTRIVNACVVLVLAALAGWVGWSLLHEDRGGTDGPVISSKEWNGYDTAGVSGVLRLEQGCLMIDDGIVLWPSGTGWDADGEAVVFGGDFEDAPDAKVGDRFEGGGGYHETGLDLESLSDIAGDPAAEALVRCLEKTAARMVINAHPSES